MFLLLIIKYNCSTIPHLNLCRLISGASADENFGTADHASATPPQWGDEEETGIGAREFGLIPPRFPSSPWAAQINEPGASARRAQSARQQDARRTQNPSAALTICQLFLKTRSCA